MDKDHLTPKIMGILNVTPDSFSDGGRFLSVDAAVEHGISMVDAGADIIDVGGESTRPGSVFVPESEELDRVIPVIEGIRQRSSITVSIDTSKPAVAKAAVLAGATIINDVSMLRTGTELAQIAATHDATLILMHSRGTPEDMQRHTDYRDVVAEVRNELLGAVNRAVRCGVDAERIWLDPGIGFAKTAEQSLVLIASLRVFSNTGYPVLVGPSRKSFISAFDQSDVDNRLGGTAAAVAVSVFNGASVVRVHDIRIMKQAAMIGAKLREAAENR
ncbi:MAG: dihydropteroate synthase [Deltaproteobacteria bacterium]|nr:dihydropteroate synthase [Deltaproteobacteria bacterium]